MDPLENFFYGYRTKVRVSKKEKIIPTFPPVIDNHKKKFLDVLKLDVSSNSQ